MKKLLAIALCVALVSFGVFGCKKPEEPDTPEADTTTVETPEEVIDTAAVEDTMPAEEMPEETPEEAPE
ncbi:hypothetical protein GF359_04895 [candidate division WOR-3 bacterium]|uniref:Uncharacterized protein n=1 Tax=candidate division WOR-3 bacterium TaxID=2052148 RepID=A0A9D5K8Z2_UNCW3|nr:hypothetical protein [candidate division WOR-3 bacterium]MBD3364532.1 hypothetical protein [candidate division WOR-3 bacterium]